MARRPGTGHLGELQMPGIPRLQAFSQEFIHLRSESIDMSDAGSARRHVSLGVFSEFNEIKIVAASLLPGRFVEGSLGAGENGQSRGKSERFLRSGQEHVDAETVKIELHRRHGTYGIHNEHDVRE